MNLIFRASAIRLTRTNMRREARLRGVARRRAEKRREDWDRKKQARQRQGDVHMVWEVFGVLMCWTSPPPKAMDATFLIDEASLHSILYVI